MRSGTLNARTLPTARSNSLIFCTAKAEYLKKKRIPTTEEHCRSAPPDVSSLVVLYFVPAKVRPHNRLRSQAESDSHTAHSSSYKNNSSPQAAITVLPSLVSENTFPSPEGKTKGMKTNETALNSPLMKSTDTFPKIL